MKAIYLLATIFILSSCGTEEPIQSPDVIVPVLNTDAEELRLKVDGEVYATSWAVDYAESPLEYEIECADQPRTVCFTDQQDSIVFALSFGETKDFLIVNSKSDTLLTQVIGIAPNHNFTKAYIKENSGTTKVKIPEVSELANILVALHPDAEKDKNMTDSDTEYYQRVKTHFQSFSDHPMMDTIQKYIKDPTYLEEAGFHLFSNDSYMYYYALKMNACTYEFDDAGDIVNQGFIKEMARGWSPFDPFKDKELMADFARKSDFRSFYKINEPYYNELLETYTDLNPIADMQQWLDQKFGFSYGNYTIYFSPLVSGAHSTKGFDTDEFKQTFMFIARAERNENQSETLNELLESRVVFTEIDHNYVNPTSARFLDQIDLVFNNRPKWTNEELVGMYDTPFMVFNEYMTFAVYSLYVHDNYSEEDLLEYLPMMEEQMEDARGFIRFKSFNRELLDYYGTDTSPSMDQLYTHMLDWSDNME